MSISRLFQSIKAVREVALLAAASRSPAVCVRAMLLRIMLSSAMVDLQRVEHVEASV